MNNELHAERIVAISFNYDYLFRSFKIKQSIAFANLGKPLGSAQCHLSMISLVIYLARIRNYHFDYGKQNKWFTDMRFLPTFYNTSESLSLD